MLSSCCRNLTWLLILRVVWICRIIFQGKLGILKNHHSFVNVLELGVCDAFHAHPLTFDIDLKLFCITYSVCTCMIYLFLFNQQVQQCSVPPRCSRRCWDRGCGVRRLWTMFRLIDVIWFWHVFGVLGTTYSAESLLWTLWLTKRVLLSVRLYCHSSERLKFELRAMTRHDAQTSFSYEYD